MGTTEYCTVLGTVGGLFDADYVTSSWERENQCSDFNFSSFYSSLEQVSNVSLPTWQRATTLLVSIYSHLPTGNRTALRYGIVRGSLWKISFRATYLWKPPRATLYKCRSQLFSTIYQFPHEAFGLTYVEVASLQQYRKLPKMTVHRTYESCQANWQAGWCGNALVLILVVDGCWLQCRNRYLWLFPTSTCFATMTEECTDVNTSRQVATFSYHGK